MSLKKTSLRTVSGNIDALIFLRNSYVHSVHRELLVKSTGTLVGSGECRLWSTSFPSSQLQPFFLQIYNIYFLFFFYFFFEGEHSRYFTSIKQFSMSENITYDKLNEKMKVISQPAPKKNVLGIRNEIAKLVIVFKPVKTQTPKILDSFSPKSLNL